MAITVVGGTHGNELLGIHLLKKWETKPPLTPEQIELNWHFGNPQAIQAVRRYIETDLNRCFATPPEEQVTYEHHRAQELKNQHSDTPPELLIDLHSTTANMGISLILSRQNALEHPKLCQVLSHLSHHHPNVYILNQPKDPNPYLPSMGLCDLTIEVGPLAHGTLQAGLFFELENVLDSIFKLWGQGSSTKTEPFVVYDFIENIDYPREQDQLCAMIHPELEAQDYQPLAPGAPLFVTFSGETVYYEGTNTVWPVFINEQAYYEKGIAMTLTHKRIHVP